MKATLNRDNRIIISQDVRIPSELAMMNPPKSFPLCGDIIKRLRSKNPDLEFSDSLRRVLDQIIREQRRIEHIANMKDIEGDPRLYPYQRVGVEWLFAIKRGILADDQGLGKTVMAAIACKKILDGIDEHPLTIGIVCTGSNLSGWFSHMQRYYLIGGIISTNKSRGEIIIDMGECGYIYIVNYDNIASLVKLDLDILIVDEAHHVRNRKTILFKRLKAIARKVEYVFLLTASPTINADFDMWTLLHLCDPERFLSYWSYIFRFFDISHTGFGMKIEGIKDSEKESFERVISTYMLRRDESVKELPNIKRRKIYYTLEDAHKCLYFGMEKDWVASLNGKEVSASVKVAQITRLRQLAISPKILFDTFYGRDKIDALVEEISASDGKIIAVFTAFEQAAKLACERLEQAGISSAVYAGTVSRKKRDELERRFGQDIRVLLITHKTGGESLTLTQATKAIILDMAWHPAGNRHSIKRIHRIGQDKEVEVVVIQSKNTVEEHMEDIVRDKGKMSVNDILNRMRRKYA